MSAAVITIVVLLVVIAVLLWVSAVARRDIRAFGREIDALRRSQQLAAEQSRAHAQADERQWRDDVPAKIWRNK